MTAPKDDIQEQKEQNKQDEKNGAAESNSIVSDEPTAQNHSTTCADSSDHSRLLPTTNPADNPQSENPTPPTTVYIL